MAPPKVIKSKPTKAAADNKPNPRKAPTKNLGADDVQFLVDCIEQTKALTGNQIAFSAVADSYNITKATARMRYVLIKNKLAKLATAESKGTED